MHRTLIRYTAYPVVAGATAASLCVAAAHGVPHWPTFPLLAGLTIGLVAWLERVVPYETTWRLDHGDRVTDIVHAVVNLVLLLAAAEAVFLVRSLGFVGADIWPIGWPVAVQCLMAGAIIDLGLYVMHRWSHSNAFLWRLHAIHHSAERLYWLNGERRHPVSAVLLAAPGLVAVVVLGAPAVIVAAWLSFIAVHLAFQHANLDYRLGPMRHVLGVAETHRWHHKREYQDAQVNFGECWMVWDHLFGTYAAPPDAVRAGDVGLRERAFPRGYLAQLQWPFERRNTPKSGVGAKP